MVHTKDTKTALLEAAMELIWLHNYGAVSVDDICGKAKAQKGSFYHYFSSKGELAKAAMENSWESLRPELDHIFSPQVPALQRLRNYADFSLKSQGEEAKRLGVVLGCPYTTLGSERCAQEDGLTEKSWEILSRFERYFVYALRDAREEGLKLENYERTAHEMFIHYLGANAVARLSNSLEPLKDLYPRWCQIFGLTQV